MTYMLMVTTTVGMFDWVHSHTSDLGPVLSLIFEFKLGCTSFEQGLITPSSSSNDPNHSPTGSLDGLPLSRWESDPGFKSIFRVIDDDC